MIFKKFFNKDADKVQLFAEKFVINEEKEPYLSQIQLPVILDEIKAKYGFDANAIVSMEEVVEHLYNKPCNGEIIIDDEIKTAIDKYYEQYGAK